MGGREAVGVDAVVSELLEVELSLPADQRFNFIVIEEAFDETHLEQALKAFLEGSQLAFALLLEGPLDIEPDKLLDVGLVDRDTGTAFLELVLSDSAEIFHISRKSAGYGLLHLTILGFIPI